VSNKGWGAHPRYLDDTWCDRGETSQWGHRVVVQVDMHRSRYEVMNDRDAISFITNLMPGELVMGETCFTLSTGHVLTMHEHRISCAAKIVFYHVSGILEFYRHILQGVGS